MSKEERSVTLIAHTIPTVFSDAVDPEGLIQEIMGVCQHREVKRAGLLKAIRSGHNSLLEHITFTFHIKGFPRPIMDEHFRQRAGFSPTAESTRYVDFGRRDIYVKETGNVKFDKRVRLFIAEFRDLYRQGAEAGIPFDVLRNLIPFGFETEWVVTLNVSALFTFLMRRQCERAHEDIQELAQMMRDEVTPLIPNLIDLAGAPCMVGECKEEYPCPKRSRSSASSS